MKKYINLLVIALSMFASCEPILDRGGIGDVIASEDQLEATVTPVMNGTKTTNKNGTKTTNKVVVNCTSPVVCQWSNGVKTYNTNNTELLLFIPGSQIVSLKAMTNDGKVLEKNFTVNVEEMTFPVPPEYAYFCGTGEKTWTWAETKCFGNGHAYAWDPVNTYPEWWILSPSDVTSQCSGKGLPNEGAGATMTFTLVGMKMSLKDASGNVISSGNFDFDMAPDGHNWSIGTLSLKNTNILFGYDLNGGLVPWTQYSIMEINDNVLRLGAKGADGTYWFWVFIPAEG